jgi:hypothetical protein
MKRRDPSELLAAHVTGGLDADEAARVEAHLADHPEARAELEAIADAIDQVRAAEPKPADEPDWDAMAAEIRRVCVEADRPRWWQLGRRWAAAIGTAAIAGVIGVVVARTWFDRAPETSPPRVATTVPTPDLPVADPVLPVVPDVHPHAADLGDSRDPLEIDDADDVPAIDPFGSADYLPVDLRADELPDEAIDAIDRLLAQVQAG